MIKKIISLPVVLLMSFMTLSAVVYAQVTTNFTQEINAGTLSVDIVDGSFDPVVSPAVALSAVSVGFACQTTTGTFGTTTQQIYVVNPNGANDGWVVSLAATDPTDVWTSALPATFDFNDPAGTGCTGGQMTVNPAAGTLAAGNCVGCTTTGITKGSSAAFNQGVTDSITILSASAGSDDIGDWTLQGVGISQKIPAQQPAANDYSLDLTLSIVAS
jgi:hypothetical protein